MVDGSMHVCRAADRSCLQLNNGRVLSPEGRASGFMTGEHGRPQSRTDEIMPSVVSTNVPSSVTATPNMHACMLALDRVHPLYPADGSHFMHASWGC